MKTFNVYYYQRDGAKFSTHVSCYVVDAENEKKARKVFIKEFKTSPLNWPNFSSIGSGVRNYKIAWITERKAGT